ncbi:MAG: energy transducer TonB [Succinivibrio sp.]|nr:energy transducer TonB [Succinivibrio sp.]
MTNSKGNSSDLLEKKADFMSIMFTALLLAGSILYVGFKSDYRSENKENNTVQGNRIELSVQFNEQTVSSDDSQLQPQPEIKNNTLKKVSEKNIIPLKREKDTRHLSNPTEKKTQKTVRTESAIKKQRTTTSQSVFATADNQTKTSEQLLSDKPLSKNSQSTATENISKNSPQYRLLLQKITSLKQYPARARRQGEEGRCEILFNVSPDGRVIAGKLRKSSGHSVLDRECRHLVSVMIGFDTQEQKGSGTVVIPIVFRLSDQ